MVGWSWRVRRLCCLSPLLSLHYLRLQFEGGRKKGWEGLDSEEKCKSWEFKVKQERGVCFSTSPLFSPFCFAQILHRTSTTQAAMLQAGLSALQIGKWIYGFSSPGLKPNPQPVHKVNISQGRFTNTSRNTNTNTNTIANRKVNIWLRISRPET